MSEKVLKKISHSLRIADGRCPNGHSLMTQEREFDGQPAIAVKVAQGGNSGMLYLNPFFGRFEYNSEIQLSAGDAVDLSCPTCGVTLKVDTMCKLCNIPMFAIQLPDGGQVEACPKIGCHNHSLTIVNLDMQLERMYVDETKIQM